MGFGGSTGGANVIFKKNRRDKKSKTKYFQKITGSGIRGIKTTETNPMEILRIRKKNKSREQKKRQRKIIIFSAVIMLMVLIIFWKVMF
ncbi:hypothetical protein DET49_12257 [Salegentibacter sp. 24]|nr:hypothetical protein DET49_12257 [Salegentibacter sp. 24]